MFNFLKFHIGNKTPLGVEFLALPSVINYTDEYRLGRKSVYMSCEYGHKPRNLLEAKCLSNGICLSCDHVRGDL